ncbi:MAG: hypothetical protein ACREBE_08155 [bacterium]
MLSRHSRVLVLALGLAGCDHERGPTLAEPLVGGMPIPVALTKTVGIPLTGLPRVNVVGLSKGVQITWEVENGPCLIASATGTAADSIVQVEIQQSGNPLADCAPGRVSYRYVANASGLAPRRYQVRLVDAKLGQPAVEVARRSVEVMP